MVYSFAPFRRASMMKGHRWTFVPENVRAPRQDQPRVAELLRLGAIADAERLGHARHPGGRADRAVEPRRAQPVEEPARHAAEIEEAHRPGVAVGQDRLGTELVPRFALSRDAMVSRALSQEMRSKRPSPFAPTRRCG